MSWFVAVPLLVSGALLLAIVLGVFDDDRIDL